CGLALQSRNVWLGNYFVKKEKIARKVADEVAKLHDMFYTNKSLQDMAKVSTLYELGPKYYSDSDLVDTLPKDLEFNTLFKQKVSQSRSSVKISDQVDRNNPKLIEAVFWSSLLDNVFKENLKNDPELRWQNFGSVEGFARTYPSREWALNFAGFHIDFDPRLRPWYIGATSGPKDIIIILDCSLSMKGKRFHMAKQVAKTVLNTLTKQDYVNVICGRESHWDEVGKWFEYQTEVLSCQQNRLVPASTSHRKDLIEKIDNLKAGGTSELKKSFKLAFELLQGTARTDCQSIIVFATDGVDNDGDPVRCGPGYYTRSGYVPGQICKYDWNDVWDEVAARNRYMSPRVSWCFALNTGSFSVVEVRKGQKYSLQMSVSLPLHRTIGVVGIDATLEEIENILLNDRWGSVYAFLVNEGGETIFHPLLRPSTEETYGTYLINVASTIDIWGFNNGDSIGCPHGQLRASVRPDVLITSLIEETWKNRSSEILKDVSWTYVGTQSGVFRSYPGHRARKNFDPTKRPWYHRALVNPSKAAISNAYMDANGIGKVITISEAVFQALPQNSSSNSCGSLENLRGGCPCTRHGQCISGKCRVYSGNDSFCAGDRVEAVTALDILYNDFHRRVYDLLKSSKNNRSCGMNYTCPDGEHICETRCYLVDNLANLVTDPDFLLVSTKDAREYERVSLGRKEGDIMKLLVAKYKLFVPNQRVDFQGICSVSPYAPKVTLEGIVRTPEQEDDYYKNRGPVPPFRNEYGCIQDVVGYTTDDSVLDPDGVIADSVDGPCRSGNFFLSALPKTNLYLLVVENWSEYRQSLFYNFNCHISNRVYDAGAFRIVNGTCAHIETETSLRKKEKCPALKNVQMKCSYNAANSLITGRVFQWAIGAIIIALSLT
ncbi:PREDICTED: uncharacterized protein LOC107332703, partial [Acropora digitifera]|uniref:uncharacterized protein LOC107332703 n=1 Tax=Acropora digitifera TaxID=70779 RepID=UPI00077A7D80